MNTRRLVNTWAEGEWWKLSQDRLNVSRQEKHLGLIREPICSATATVSENIKKSRRCVYSLMGAGIHGLNGLHPEISVKLWVTYALPQLVYGLELHRIGAGNLKRLEICQNRILRKIQHLPESTATVALHLLAGIPPVQATIERSTLMLFRNLVDQKSTKEYEIIERQLAMKDHKSNSWVVHVKELLTKYNLPSAFVVFQSPPSKSTWKRQAKKPVKNFWLTKLKDEASQMATLEYLNTTKCLFGKLYPIWHYTPYNRIDILQACTLVKFKVGRYHLQEDLSKFRGTTYWDARCVRLQQKTCHI